MTIINSVIKGKQPVIDTLPVTPSTSAQTIIAPAGTDGYSPVNVSAVTAAIDNNITAGNIKKDVQILGVTGSYEGTVPTGTKGITSNGGHNIAAYEYADVQVPTTAPAYYIEKTKDANNKLVNGASTVIDLTGITDINSYGLAYAYWRDTSITGALDLSDLVQVTGQGAFSNTFYQCTGLTSVDLSSLKYVQSGAGNEFPSAFYGCTGLTSINLSSLKYVNGSSAFTMTFYGCTGLTSINLSSLINVTNTAFTMTFYGCTGLTSVDLSKLTISGGFSQCFQGCTNLTTVDISHLCKINGTLSSAFRNCTSLTTLSFPSLAYTTTSLNGYFQNMLNGVTGCTVHFPSEWQTTMSSWSNVTAGFGGTNTTILFDLPTVTTLDLSYITEGDVRYFMYQFDMNNYFPNITSVDLSGLTSISAENVFDQAFKQSTSITRLDLSSLTTISGSSGCITMCEGCTGLVSVDLSSLTTISGANACKYMFLDCSGLTSVDLSSLTTVTGYNACSSMFRGCTSLTTVNLSNLTNLNGNLALETMFNGCTSLTSLSFPALTSTSFGSYNNQFSNMIYGISGITLHFPSNLQSVIEGLAGYSATAPFGATSGTVLFDLPATI